VINSQLKMELLMDKSSDFYDTLKHIFDTINAAQDFDQYTYPQGKIFIAFFAILFNILLLSFLVSMFINRYKYVYRNIDALRRMNIIKLKNFSSFDEIIGGVSLSFFPVNVFLLIPMVGVVVFKSERLSDFVLKV